VKPVIVAGDHTKFLGGKLNNSLTLSIVFLKINHSSLTSLRHKHVPVFSPPNLSTGKTKPKDKTPYPLVPRVWGG
jgi:hypothetical protein